MKYLGLYCSLIFMFFGCSKTDNNVDNASSEVLNSNISMASKMPIFPACKCSEISLIDGLMAKENKPFSGSCFSMYPTVNQKYEERFYFGGIITWQKFYDKNGNKLIENLFKNGQKIQDFSTCDCNDLDFKLEAWKKRAFYKQQVFSGTCKSYYPKINQVYVETFYHKGLRDGISITYDKNGKILTQKLYSEGKLKD